MFLCIFSSSSLFQIGAAVEVAILKPMGFAHAPVHFLKQLVTPDWYSRVVISKPMGSRMFPCIFSCNSLPQVGAVVRVVILKPMVITHYLDNLLEQSATPDRCNSEACNLQAHRVYACSCAFSQEIRYRRVVKQ